MASILFFTPKAELDAIRNLAGFVEIARTHLKTIREDLCFEDNIWRYLGKRREHQIRFGTRASTKRGARNEHMVPFQEPFLSFSKAYLRYLQALEPVSTPETFRLLVLRLVYDALLDVTGASDITSLTPMVMNRAVELLRDSYAGSTLSSYGYEMQRLCVFLQENRLVHTPFSWRSPIKHNNHYARIGEDFEARRKDKLPSPTALAALAHVYRHSTYPAEILASGVGALLCCAPARISEVLTMDAYPEHSEKASDGSVKFGLRWRPAKGGKPQVKWVPAPMIELAKEALKRIRSLTDKARKVAKWYEENPGCVYLPEHLEHLRSNTYLNTRELAQVLWGDDVDTGRLVAAAQWLEQGVDGEQLSVVKEGKLLKVPFEEVQKKLLSLLPDTFPFIDAGRGVKYSEALFVTLRNSLQSELVELQCVIEPLTHGFVSGRFGGKPSVSMFTAHGLFEDDGTPIHLRSHQCRHYLNMAGQRNNMSQLDIALWSGRRVIRQNQAYDHVSARDLAVRADEVMGGNVEAPAPLVLKTPGYLVARSDFVLANGITAHTTEFGHCVHDYTMLPCTRFRDCLNCEEHLCVKGDEVKEAALRRHLDETRELLKLAQGAHAEGDFGADRWVEHQTKTVERMERLIAILNDPCVPAGSVIRTSLEPGASRIEQARRRRALALSEKGSSNEIPQHTITTHALPAPSKSADVEEAE